MPYRDELEALRARLAALEEERDAERDRADALERLLHAPEGPGAPRRRPIDPRWCSVPGGEPVTLMIANASDRKIEVFWLSYEGKERSAGTLVPGGRVQQQSYVGHVWRFVDAGSGIVLSHRRVEPEARLIEHSGDRDG